MPRKTRMYVPGVPAHIVQRGNNRDATFFCDEDFIYYKEVLGDGLRRYGATLHAYCLMTNHVHLLMTPSYKDSISRVMQHIGRNYVFYVNHNYSRTGTLWEGRHKSCMVDAENYLLTTYRYIELNPVAAGMVNSPGLYPWSSFRCNGLGATDELVEPHEIYLSLGAQGETLLAAYQSLFEVSIPDDDVRAIRETLEASYPLGNTRFKVQIEAALGRKLGKLKRGGRVGIV
jgi:putative transposase